jgi:hypothetical protein
MAAKTTAFQNKHKHNPIKKGTSIGRRPKSMATMNKSRKRSFKKYRGQG